MCGLAAGGKGKVGIGMIGWGEEGSVVIGRMVVFFVGGIGSCWFVSWSIGNGLGNGGEGIVVMESCWVRLGEKYGCDSVVCLGYESGCCLIVVVWFGRGRVSVWLLCGCG